jgi:hypothetical protein
MGILALQPLRLASSPRLGPAALFDQSDFADTEDGRVLVFVLEAVPASSDDWTSLVIRFTTSTGTCSKCIFAGLINSS